MVVTCAKNGTQPVLSTGRGTSHLRFLRVSVAARGLDNGMTLVRNKSHNVNTTVIGHLTTRNTAITFACIDSDTGTRRLRGDVANDNNGTLTVGTSDTSTSTVHGTIATAIRTFNHLSVLIGGTNILTITPLRRFGLRSFSRALTVGMHDMFVTARTTTGRVARNNHIVGVNDAGTSHVPFTNNNPCTVDGTTLINLAGNLSHSLNPHNVAIGGIRPNPISASVGPTDNSFTRDLVPLVTINHCNGIRRVTDFITCLTNPRTNCVANTDLAVSNNFNT